MRISTSSTYENAVTQFNSMQANISNTINQIDTGVAITSPADNPAAASQVLVVSQADSVETQLGVNRNNATSALSTSDGVLSGVTSLLQNMETQIVEAGNGSLSSADRATIATQLQSSMSQLMTLANSTDGNGNYMFSGTATSTPPFVASANGATYNGNQNTQMLQVSNAQQTAVTTVGTAVFGNIITSPNAFFGIPDANNTSSATISAGTVSNPAALTGDNYEISFTSPTAYNVTDSSTGAVVSTANAYTSGSPITFDGITLSVSDGTGANATPAAGDQFAVQPGNQNIFQTLNNAITALNNASTSTAGQANLATSLSQANSNISAALNNVLNVRDSYGNSMQQVTSLNSVGSTVDLAYKTTIGTLQNVNYAQAISQLSLEQFTYEAAQKSFASTSKLDLINML